MAKGKTPDWVINRSIGRRSGFLKYNTKIICGIREKLEEKEVNPAQLKGFIATLESLGFPEAITGVVEPRVEVFNNRRLGQIESTRKLISSTKELLDQV
jgi:hypothetical protein